jgi:hypothetical protein
MLVDLNEKELKVLLNALYGSKSRDEYELELKLLVAVNATNYPAGCLDEKEC